MARYKNMGERWASKDGMAYYDPKLKKYVALMNGGKKEIVEPQREKKNDNNVDEIDEV